MPTQGRKVHSIEKAITLLDCFWTARRPLALTELVQMTGWAKSTIHGMLSSMTDSRVIEQNETDGKYRLGYHLFELGSAVNSSWSEISRARARLLHIVTTTKESSYLARLCGDDLLLAVCAEPSEGFRVSTEEGTRIPLHCTSQGKVILANLPEATAKAMLERKGMHAYTPRTIRDWETLRGQLEEIRQRGYALERSEYQVGLQSIGVPIFDGNGQCRYAISIVGVMRGTAWNEFDETLKLLMESAAAISYDLGYRGGRTI